MIVLGILVGPIVRPVAIYAYAVTTVTLHSGGSCGELSVALPLPWVFLEGCGTRFPTAFALGQWSQVTCSNGLATDS
eukprot:3263428-Rhodomonas_salina.1